MSGRGASVSVKDLYFTYPGGQRGLRGVNLCVRSGEFVIITGPSGGGKSTLLRAIAGMVPQLYRGSYRGRVRIDGRDSSTTPLHVIARKVAFVFQEPGTQYVSDSLAGDVKFTLECLSVPEEEIDPRTLTALEEVGLSALAGRAPLTLSGGQQQKGVIASTLAGRRGLVLLDEPFSMLDAPSGVALLGELRELHQKGVTIIVAEHRYEPFRKLPEARFLECRAGQVRKRGRPQGAGELPEIGGHPGGDVLLACRGLGVIKDGRRILENVSLRARSGEAICLMGPNGSGKTMLLRALAGLEKHSGKVETDDDNVSVGLVMEEPDHQLGLPTVREELADTGADATSIRDIAEALHLDGMLSHSPLELSLGERKRVTLAQGLLAARDGILLLDEPTMGQDPRSLGYMIRGVQAHLDRGGCAIIATHDGRLARACTRVVTMDAPGATRTVGGGESIVGSATRTGGKRKRARTRRGPRNSSVPSGILEKMHPLAKLVLCTGILATVFLPGPLPLLASIVLIALMGTGGLHRPLLKVLRRSWWMLLAVLALDLLLMGPLEAVVLTAKLAILFVAFIPLSATTGPGEIADMLESLGLPYSWSFVLSRAFGQIEGLEWDVRLTLESLVMRHPGERKILLGRDGKVSFAERIKRSARWLRTLPGVLVPVVIRSIKNAWTTYEAAVVRGIGNPKRTAGPPLHLGVTDTVVILLGGTLVLLPLILKIVPFLAGYVS